MAFLDSLMHTCMQKGSTFTEAEVQDEINTIMFEGHDTTAAGSSFFLCLLGTLPEIQKKVVQEQREIFHGSDRPCTFADTIEMKYLERVILETLRLYPPVPAISREIKTDTKLGKSNFADTRSSFNIFLFQHLGIIRFLQIQQLLQQLI